MAVMTPWGYEVTETECGMDAKAVPPLLDEFEFEDYVPGLSSTPDQVRAVLEAASASVRDWCGWHVGPALACEWVGDGEGRHLFLPVMALRSVTAIVVDGSEIAADAYEWRDTGVVRLKSGAFPDSWRSVTARFVAGVDAASLKQVVAQVAANALTAAPGVAEEHAGSVGVTYNRTADGVTGGVRLLASDCASLAPYRIARAW